MGLETQPTSFHSLEDNLSSSGNLLSRPCPLTTALSTATPHTQPAHTATRETRLAIGESTPSLSIPPTKTNHSNDPQQSTHPSEQKRSTWFVRGLNGRKPNHATHTIQSQLRAQSSPLL
ncbi:unnamed protein product [Ectocarpus sp. 6 AP-2014]